MFKYLVITLLFGFSAYAAPYGDAGCGLGSVIFGQEKAIPSQVMAATTNGSSGIQTFGITSGTSNCVDKGAVKGAKAVPAFIEVNRVALEEDAARGSGETVNGLAKLLGCEPKNLGETLKTNYGKIFGNMKSDSVQVEAGINSLILSDKAKACGA